MLPTISIINFLFLKFSDTRTFVVDVVERFWMTSEFCQLSTILAIVMAGSIKLFQFNKKLYEMLGVYPHQNNEKILFNSRNLFILFCCAQFCISMAAFFIFKAKTMQEYNISIYMSLTQFYIMINFLLLMWQISNILNLITDFEEFIEKSE